MRYCHEMRGASVVRTSFAHSNIVSKTESGKRVTGIVVTIPSTVHDSKSIQTVSADHCIYTSRNHSDFQKKSSRREDENSTFKYSTLLGSVSYKANVIFHLYDCIFGCERISRLIFHGPAQNSTNLI